MQKDARLIFYNFLERTFDAFINLNLSELVFYLYNSLYIMKDAIFL
jgi:hypothetical protein